MNIPKEFKYSKDPYGEGWIAKIEIIDSAELAELLDSEIYEQFVAEGGH
ncbi:Glycine cleavage system H protein [Sporomusa ovata DSM 2662]|uniref:Glycine cleavage system H protein n=2 Tax=Sporomusa ovata TaxID=2378 RepID=A0A0U1L048_9FIRM|nr:glycine cleavage system H protein [Sporomusa ovata]EQB27196.1 glycine cleavage system H protein [Sporomusa ovata DSM 2662]CQR73036.1 hypothetical protein SpAn4DRAFT_2268 [Sporomusa ovata]